MGERCFCLLHQRARHETCLLRASREGACYEDTRKILCSLAAIPKTDYSQKTVSLSLPRLGGSVLNKHVPALTSLRQEPSRHRARVDKLPAPFRGTACPLQASIYQPSAALGGSHQTASGCTSPSRLWPVEHGLAAEFLLLCPSHLAPASQGGEPHLEDKTITEAMKMTWKFWEITICTHNCSANSPVRPQAFFNVFRCSQVYA